MFTGIIGNLGIVTLKKSLKKQIRMGFQFQTREKNVQLGESIAVNGVCLTVKKKNPDGFEADVVGETLKATNLGSLQIGHFVNLERSLRAGDAIGGHFVTGHVDCCGEVDSTVQKGKDYYFTVKVPDKILPYLAAKGSVAIDGVSLTVQMMKGNHLTVTLVPHTLKVTTLGKRNKAERVNLEVDMMARYVLEALKQKRPKADKKKYSLKFYQSQGF